ncbi:hypothetical protein [Microcoleus sp. FACHB-68]|uniref:hypothetical protein n=1 Tax=Microcoleus sp. FACHB-68 TaxID=2692826 RepID=UPI00168635C7|nr:hypothetical protein [Microcoleus sp. FACHB-68]MBD1940467.1 hypothetical protein [Microcoleus sp. FACHB-68]
MIIILNDNSRNFKDFFNILKLDASKLEFLNLSGVASLLAGCSPYTGAGDAGSETAIPI